MSNNTEHRSMVIIGSGPAGYTAAIYGARAGYKPLVYEGLQPGGQLTITTDVENYPGYPDGIMGPDMMVDFKKQAERMGAEVRFGMITAVDFSSRPHKLTIDAEKEMTADAVIICTGASAKWLGLESEQRLNGFGVSACAVCDGFFFRDLEVAIVGGGDTAAEEATYLAKLCKKVYMLVRRDELRASKAMQDRVFKTKNIEMLWNHEVKEVLGEQKVSGIKMLNNKTNEEKELDVQGLFIAIGHKPNTDIFKEFLEMDSVGYIKNKAGTSKTNIEGVFVGGDAADNVYRQAVTAAGMGCMAALDAERWLGEQGIEE